MRKSLFYIISLFFFVFPLFFLIYKSFFGVWVWGAPAPAAPSLRAWKLLLNEGEFLGSIGVSLWIALVVLALNMLIGITAGKAFSFSSFKGKTLIESLLLLPLFLPVLVIAIGLHLTFIRYGLSDHWIGVALVHLVPTVPYSIKMFKSGYERIGAKLMDQSMVLGGNPWQRFYHIELPLLLPSVRSVLFLTIVISLSQYVLTAIIGGGNVVTLAMVYYPFTNTADEAVMAAFSLVFALIPFMLYILLEGCLKLILPYQRLSGRKQS
ncbi:ABC transporter permease [Bacillus sp. KH172YL63]|uniref:ABC transporter permease n=1 Tax=Bacillus sp. KH172YL63 TaxID=2709784 RepID=UPI0013E41300|nr:ABC transporter permease subunit [Bacillus sp. KH172YL63]BCB02076.1 ABC transporter membrane protein [Bacillus sp. KH172YL63]